MFSAFLCPEPAQRLTRTGAGGAAMDPFDSGTGVGAGFGRAGMVAMRRTWVRVPSVTAYDGVRDNLKKVIESAEAALAANPDSREKHRALVQALSYAGELDHAREIAAKWLERDKLDPQALGYTADLLGRDGQRELALRTLAGLVDVGVVQHPAGLGRRLVSQEAVLLVALLLLFLVVGLINPRFVAERNLQTIFLGNAYVAVAAIGMSMVIISGNIDVSVGSLIGVLAVLSGSIAVAGWPIWLSWLVPVLAGMAVNGVMGFLVAYLRIPSIVVTLGFLSILKGGLIMATGGAWISNLPPGYALAQMEPLGVPMPIWFMVLLTFGAATVGAAPHDWLTGCGGALALHARAGVSVHVVLLTEGEAGWHGAQPTSGAGNGRLAESAQAAQLLGIEAPQCWHLPDRGVVYGEELVERMMHEVRQQHPRVRGPVAVVAAVQFTLRAIEGKVQAHCAAHAHHREAVRQPAHRGRRRSRARDGSPRRADPGLLRHPLRPPVRDAGAHRRAARARLRR